MLDNRFAFSLVLCAIVFPMIVLDKIADPLAGTMWSRMTSSASGIVPYVLALIYAGAASLLLRRRKTTSLGAHFIAGSITGLIPALFYALAAPFATTNPPLAPMFLGGLIFGPLFGGTAFILIRHDDRKRYDA